MKEIKKVLKAAPSMEMRMKLLRKAVGESVNLEGEELKQSVKSAIKTLKSKNKLTVTDNMVALQQKSDEDQPQNQQKRSSPTEDTDDQPSKASEPAAKKARKEQTNNLVDHGSGGTRLFLGNLSFKITDEKLKSAIPGITHIKWITDKETKQFYGSAFVEMETHRAAKAAVALAGGNILGRPLKANFAPARPGDIWPPVNQSTGGGGHSGGIREPSEKPFEDCLKLFIGNLSYEIDDDTIYDFFKNCGEVRQIRWLTHQDSGDFRGCGYIEFNDSNAADEAILLNGKEILGRPIRIDWDGGRS